MQKNFKKLVEGKWLNNRFIKALVKNWSNQKEMIFNLSKNTYHFLKHLVISNSITIEGRIFRGKSTNVNTFEQGPQILYGETILIINFLEPFAQKSPLVLFIPYFKSISLILFLQ